MIIRLLYSTILLYAFVLYPMYKPTYTADSLRNISMQQLGQRLVNYDLQEYLEKVKHKKIPQELIDYLKKTLVDDNLLLYLDIFQHDMIAEAKRLPLQLYFTSDGNTLITTSGGMYETTINIISWPSLELKGVIECPEYILSLAVVPFSGFFFTAHEESLRLWSIEEKKCVQEFKKEKGIVCDLVTNPQGTVLLVRSGLHRCLYSLMKLDSFPYTLSEPCTQTDEKSSIGPLELTPDGKYALESENKHLCFLSLLTGQLTRIATVKEHNQSITLSPDGSFLIALSGTAVPAGNGLSTLNDLQPYLFAIKGGERMLPVHLPGHTCLVKAVKISPNSKFFVTGDEKGTIRFWDARTLTSLKLKNHPLTSIYEFHWTPDGKSLLVKGDKDETYVYHLEQLMGAASINELVLIAKLKNFGAQKVLSNSYYRSIFETSSYRDKLIAYFKI